MFGIYKITKGKFFDKWIGSWFVILDCLFGILTLQFYFCDFSNWWYEGDFDFGKDVPLLFKSRIMWWFADLVAIFGEVIPIVSLGRFATTWGLQFFMRRTITAWTPYP